MHSEVDEHWVQEQIRHFGRLSPPGYIGMGTAIEAEDWLRKIAKVLDTMVITSDTD